METSDTAKTSRTGVTKPTSLDRRRALKVGALTGVAGALTVAGLGQLGSSPAVSSTLTSSAKSMDDWLSALVYDNVMQPFKTVTFFYVPPNSDVTINHKVPAGHVAVVTEDRINVGKDHTLQMAISIDGRRILFDPDLVQSRYSSALDFLTSSSFYPIHDNFSMMLTNLTSKTRYFSSMESGGLVPASQLDSMIKSNFANIFKS